MSTSGDPGGGNEDPGGGNEQPSKKLKISEGIEAILEASTYGNPAEGYRQPSMTLRISEGVARSSEASTPEYPAGGYERPSSVPKISDGVATENLRQRYIKILMLMLKYHTECGVVPRADSADFYEFVLENGLAGIRQEELTRALLFMEESFEKTFSEHGKNANIMDRYLHERFQLSKQVWGPLRDERARDADDLARLADDDPGKTVPAEQEWAADDDQTEAVVDNLEDQFEDDYYYLVVDPEEDAMDLAILKTIREFKIKKNGMIPEADCDELYGFFVSLGISDMQQDQFVDRILIMEENFNRFETWKMMGDVILFAAPSSEEIYALSSWIWGDPYQVNNQDTDAESMVDDGGNLFDEQALVDNEIRVIEQEDQGGGADNGVNEEDLGEVEG